MAPVFMDEFNDRKDYYLKYLTETVGLDVTSKDDEELLKTLQDYRRDQYETLMDTVYTAKGYDVNSIPTDETLKRLGFEDESYSQIVEAARLRVAG